MHTPSITLREGGRNSAGEEEPTFTACSSSSFGYFRVVPAFCLGVVAAVAFQLAWGGLTLTSFFLKLFIYASFALMCVLAGSFVLLIRKSPLKVSHFEGGRRLTAGKHDFINKLMVSFLYFFPAIFTHTCKIYTHAIFTTLETKTKNQLCQNDGTENNHTTNHRVDVWYRHERLPVKLDYSCLLLV